jgi:hypothetical protein
MKQIVSIPFQYQNQSFQMLMSHRAEGDRLRLRVTVMNGELEKCLHNNSVFEYANGCVAAQCKEVPDEVAELQRALSQAMDQYWKEHPLEDLHAATA